MKFISTPLSGAYLIQLKPIEDERGFFARTFCAQTFAEQGLNPHLEQCSTAFNRKKGTLRGLHYQVSPYAEIKLIRCFRGAIYDVILDLRPESPTFGNWAAFELTEENRTMLYIPEGCAHGYQTLTDNTELFYQMSERYVKESERGVRWNDPSFDIRWPEERNLILSFKDESWPDFPLRPSCV